MNGLARYGLAAVILAFAGCGGDGTAPDGKTKERIIDASLTIATECVTGGTDKLMIEQNVDTLIAAAKKAGDTKFDLGKFKDTTMPAQLDRRADRMDRDGCAPDQADRLREAAK